MAGRDSKTLLEIAVDIRYEEDARIAALRELLTRNEIDPVKAEEMIASLTKKKEEIQEKIARNENPDKPTAPMPAAIKIAGGLQGFITVFILLGIIAMVSTNASIPAYRIYLFYGSLILNAFITWAVFKGKYWPRRILVILFFGSLLSLIQLWPAISNTPVTLSLSLVPPVLRISTVILLYSKKASRWYEGWDETMMDNLDQVQ